MASRSRILLRTLLPLAACGAMHAQANSVLPRGESQPTTTLAPQSLGGWYTWRQIAPRDESPGAGNLVASRRLLYTVHTDVDQNLDVTINIDKSVDGGRTWAGSRPIHTVDTRGGARLDSEFETVLDAFAYGRHVYVLWMSNEHAPGGTDQSVWVLGSDDQGETWSAPAQLSTGVGTVYFDTNEATAVATDQGLYVAWLGDYVTGKPLTGSPADAWRGDAVEFENDYIEDVFVTRITAAAGQIQTLLPERNLTGYAGRRNCDWLQLDAEGDVAHLVWSDDAERGLPAGAQDRVVRSATTVDGGANFTTRVHTPIYGGSYDKRWFRGAAAVDVWQGTTYVYSFSEDNRTGAGDQVWMDRAQVQAGVVQWTDVGVNCTNVPGETEGFRAHVDRGLIQIATLDFATGDVYAIYDGNAGADFVAGTATSHAVQTQDYPNWEWEIPINNFFHDGAVHGDNAGFVYEDCSPEDAKLVYTTDRGRTATLRTLTSQGGCSGGPLALDVDEVFLEITGNGDFSAIWLQNQPGGDDSTNGLWTSSTKFPSLTYDPSTLTLTMSGLSPNVSSRGDAAFLMLSQGTAGVDVPGALLTGTPDYGYFVGLTADSFFFGLWDDPGWAVRPAPADATEIVWTGIPPVSTLLGMDVYVVGGTVDTNMAPQQTGFFRAFTDPISVR